MATRCSEHAYINDGVNCPYCTIAARDAEIDDIKEKLRIAIIHASEYKLWVEKAESEIERLTKERDEWKTRYYSIVPKVVLDLATERKALELMKEVLHEQFRNQKFDTDVFTKYTPDYFRKKAQEAK